MTGEARSIVRVLLARHAQRCRPLHLQADSITRDDINHCTIPYLELCENAGVPYLLRSVGRFLEEIAEWCQANGWPPLNSLAVNRQNEQPGDGYDGAADGYCSLLRWPEEVRSCIAFEGYPPSSLPLP